jgi:hypothetical protein
MARNVSEPPWAAKRLLGLANSPGNPGFMQVVRAHIHLHPVSQVQSDESLAHFPGNGRKHDVLIIQFHPEHCACQDSNDLTFNLDVFFHEFAKYRRNNDKKAGPALTDPAVESKNE